MGMPRSVTQACLPKGRTAIPVHVQNLEDLHRASTPTCAAPCALHVHTG